MASEQAEKLRRRLLAEIGSNALPEGARLGSERELAIQYQVSRTTLRQVLAGLEEAGLIRRVPGRTGGTFVSHAKVERDLDRVIGVPAYLARQGYAAGTRVLSTQMGVADPATRRSLGLTEGDLVIEIRRLRLADGRPFSLDHARFPADRFAGLMEMPLGGSLYELLADTFGAVPEDAAEMIEVVHATEEEAALLSVGAGDPLLSITRTTFDAEGTPLEHSHDLFRADRTQIMMRTPGMGLRGDPESQHNHFVKIAPAPS